MLLWMVYKSNLTIPDATESTSDTLLNSTRSVVTEARIQNTVNHITPDHSMNAKSTNGKSYLDDAKLTKIAFERAKQGADIPEGLAPQITYKGENAEIVWPIQWPPDTIFPRGSYHALVEINRESGEIIKVLGPP